MGGSGDGGASSCADLLLTAHQFIVGGAPTTETTADGAVIEVEASTTIVGDEGEEGGVTLSGGGISEIPPQYKAGEIDSVTATSLTLTGLTNGKNYHVVVTSIDGSGNVGPASPPQCAIPEPTSGFWKTYKSDNGSATGCALETGDGSSRDLPIFALGLGAVAAAFVRRRRSRR
jgi:MYXO-CTERM domain-containing protein